MATVRKLESGKWQAIVRRKGHTPAFRSFQARIDAERWIRQLESEMDRGCYLDRTEAERTTIGALIDRYLVEVTPTKRSTQSETSCLHGLKRQFGRMAVSALQARHVAVYRDERLGAGKAGGTVIHELNALSHVIDTAIRDWSLPLFSNPVKLVRKPKAAKGRNRRLQGDEEQRLIEACKTSRSGFMLVALVQLALETAMRLGELLSLEWPLIDMQKRIARLPLTKNGDSRDVPLSTDALAVLNRVTRNISDSRVFWVWRRVDSVEHAWQRAVKRAGIDNLRFHDLRHEATSRLFEKGLNPMEVSAITGHKTLQMLKRYTHLKAEDLALKLG